jgi:hypothetical protein
MFNKLKQVKDLRSRAKDLQSTLSQENAEGSAGWGKVKIQINGNHEILKVEIDPEVMGSREKLEGMVKDAANDAVKKVQHLITKKLKESGGMDLASEFGDMLKK